VAKAMRGGEWEGGRKGEGCWHGDGEGVRERYMSMC
jgi:hypothetical protein